MNRITTLPRTVRYLALTAATLVGVAACSSDTSKTSIQDLSTVDVTLPSGATLPAGLPGSDECKAVYVQFITAITSAYVPGSNVDFASVFGDVSSKVPADLQDDLTILAAAYQNYGQVLSASGGDSSTPEVQAAVAAIQTPEVSAAGQAVTSYFDETCPGAL
ncbi:hypothetical protein BH10ACT2_BH10ACT2_12920 [soil metagenome]